MGATARASVHPWQFGLVVCAALTPLVPLIAWSGHGYFTITPGLVTAAVVAVPLLLHSRPSGFGWSIGFISALLVPWSILGAMGGMFLFFPSVLQLLLAAGADPRRRPIAAKVMAGAGFLLSAVLLALFVRDRVG
ncbi:hypothetical protein [Streptomyces sp. NPDC091371]|uniref:hypothetical protein n=1 Tax=Streptomyces sp. NPDC091371 TaxID=3155303 RepID=UPI00342862F7